MSVANDKIPYRRYRWTIGRLLLFFFLFQCLERSSDWGDCFLNRYSKPNASDVDADAQPSLLLCHSSGAQSSQRRTEIRLKYCHFGFSDARESGVDFEFVHSLIYSDDFGMCTRALLTHTHPWIPFAIASSREPLFRSKCL